MTILSNVRRAADLADWIHEQVAQANAHGLVVGLSGGLDSAVVARLCKMARPAQTIAAILPCHSDPRDEQDADLVVSHFGLQAVRLDLGPTYDLLTGELEEVTAQLPCDQVAAGPSTDVKGRLPTLGLDSIASTPDEFTQHIKNEIQRWGDVIRRAK